MKKLILYASMLILTACGMATGYFNAPNNGPYSTQEVVAYLRKLGIQRSEIYSFNTDAYHRTALKLKKGIPEAEIFNSQGEALRWPRARFSLATRLQKVLKNYPDKMPAVDKNNKRQLQFLFNQLHDISGKKSRPDAIGNYDLHLVIYFSLNSETPGDELLKYCNELLQNNLRPRMKVYFVSMDQQFWWQGTIQEEIQVEDEPLSP